MFMQNQLMVVSAYAFAPSRSLVTSRNLTKHMERMGAKGYYKNNRSRRQQTEREKKEPKDEWTCDNVQFSELKAALHSTY